MWNFKFSFLTFFTLSHILPLIKALTTDGCGISIGCLRVPAECDLASCTYLANYQSDGDQVIFDLFARSSAWVSIGFSDDKKMANTLAVFCYQNNGIVVLRTGNLVDTAPPSSFDEDNNLALLNSSSRDDSIQCSFSHPLRPSSKSNLRSLEQELFLLYAKGPLRGDNLGYHGFEKANRGTSADRVKVTTSAESKASSPSNLKKRVHGSLMVVVWIFFASIGLFFARYTRNVWSDVKLLDQKVWFQFHRLLMVVVVLGTIMSIIVIFVDRDGFTEGEDNFKTHAILGLVVLALATLQPIGALLRPHPDTPKRPIFNLFHRLFGVAAFIISLAAILLGLDIFNKDNAYYLVLGYAGFLGLVIIVMEVVKFVFEKKSIEAAADTVPGGMQMQTKIAKKSTAHLTMAKIFLGILLLIALAVTIVVIYYINED